jgi:serine/threonine protein kinase
MFSLTTNDLFDCLQLHDGILKLCDFGIAKTIDTINPLLTTHIGTYNWMAPGNMDILTFSCLHSHKRQHFITEVMKIKPYNEKADVWSFGMVLYELTTNRIPYDYCGENIPFLIGEVCHKQKIPPIPNQNQIHPVLLNLMRHCWNWNPEKRPSFNQIVQTLRNAVAQSKPTTKK